MVGVTSPIPQLPLWSCPATVRAAKIVSTHALLCGGSLLRLDGDTQVEVPRAFVARYWPEVGGYLIDYGNERLGYLSAEIFESEYKVVVVSGNAEEHF